MSGLVVLDSVYALALLAGGAMGYAKAKSAPSLVAGIVSAGLAIAAAVLLRLQHPRSGLGLGIVLSLAMAAFFVGRYRQTGKAMPSIPVIVLSLVVLVASLARLAAAGRHA